MLIISTRSVLVICMVQLSLSGCPLRKLSAAESFHEKTLVKFNDTEFRLRHERKRLERESIFGRFRAYIKYCVKPVFSCGSTFSSYSGICNNVLKPKWGAVHSCLLRLLPANYADGVASPVQLPPASSISVKLRSLVKRSSVDPPVTGMFFAFGQFLDHDLASSVISAVAGRSCCEPAESADSRCGMALDVRADPFYRNLNVTCVNFVRAARCPCSSGARDQMNAASSYVDLSHVYGSDELVVDFLKDDQRPYLLRTEQGVQLPLGGTDCVSSRCFVGGDSRINQQAALTTLHTIFMRNHNFIAGDLRQLNPDWTNVLVFEEARRINIAQFQVILLKEFLPPLLGPEVVREKQQLHFAHHLRTASAYDANLEAGMFNEFLTAAFRLHTMIPDKLGGTPFKFFNVDDYFATDRVDHATSIAQELIRSRGKEATFPVSEIAAHHIYDTDGDYGLDLVAVNIQRGRDHGLRSYVDYLAFLRNVTVTEFEDLAQLMDEDALRVLKSVYEDVNDIDFYVGGHLEKPLHGLLGATMAEVVTKQFARIVESDRFFITHRKYFRRDQFVTLMNTTFASVLCATTNSEDVPAQLFSPESRRVLCSENVRLQLHLWKA